jgi:putative tricarboxylic transport membrane protein
MTTPEPHSVQAAAGSAPDAGSPHTGGPPATAGAATTPGREGVLSTRMAFLVALTLLAVAYTVMAFGMEWRDDSGQIGPGFFPRMVGLATVAGCLVAIARAAFGAAPGPAVDADGEPEVDAKAVGGTQALATTFAVGLMVLFYLIFDPLGALLSSVVFLGLMLSLVNRGHHLQNAILTVGVPVTLYVLFEVLLDAGLPPGLVLPL